MPIDDTSDLMGRAGRLLGNHRVDQALAKVRAIIGPAAIPASEEAAQSALDKMRKGEVPTAQELAALEIVIRLLRPAPLCQGGILADLPSRPGNNLYPDSLKDEWSAFRNKVRAYLPSVGRIETVQGELVGTGFLVKEGLLATNRHVLDVLTFGSEVLQRGMARIAFQFEANTVDDEGSVVDIEGVAVDASGNPAVHPFLDMALLRVKSNGRPPLPVNASAPASGSGVVAVGYPGKDDARNPKFLDAVFEGQYGVKRAALGEILKHRVPAFFHDCSTAGGNSGSPLFSLATAEVIGIHRAGFFMYRNEAVDGGSLEEFIKTAA